MRRNPDSTNFYRKSNLQVEGAIPAQAYVAVAFITWIVNTLLGAMVGQLEGRGQQDGEDGV